MCGITGVIKPSFLSRQDIAAIRQASAAMIHRGPDGSGEYLNTDDEAHGPQLFMAMRRLSIVDLAHGWQPLWNEDKSIAIIVNGEIYNHVELRAGLLARGHTLRTNSDCEVITHLYEDHGLEFVKKLRGMFAFALWDSRKRQLILGRDRMGEKPLYLYTTGDCIWFASELKVLLATHQVPFMLDPASINSYLHYGWIPEPATAIEGVTKLPPGHLMVVDLDPWNIRTERYWRLEDAEPVTGNAVDLLRAELETIGTQIVRADVPIGIALSGGFDSSLTAAIAIRHADSAVKAFTVGYEGNPGQDERSDAIKFANDLGIPHHAIEISNSDMANAFPAVAFNRDDPVADIAGYGYYMLGKHSRDAGCPVLLQGQGADELMWGYPWAIQAVKHSLQKLAGHPVGRAETFFSQLPSDWSRAQLARFAYLVGGLLAGWRNLTPGRRSPADQLVLYDLTDPYQIGVHAAHSTYTPRFRHRVNAAAISPATFFHHNGDGSRIDIQILALLCRGYLLQNGLAQGDRLAMAHSVELRLPLVDYRFAELIVAIQKHSSVYFGAPKSLLHRAAQDLLPAYVMSRSKRGFNPPVSQWIAALRSTYGRELCNGMLVNYGVLDSRAARNMSTHNSRFGVSNDLFHKYLVLEYWYRGMHAVSGKPAAALH
ncbi:MAG: asparagine synthase (glutamine-hydrolyzing) [Steroidobacter sp.]